ncbi:MAG TPA: hypothetical protein VJK49_04670, partial [Candidatus Limnocylindrales bacterium]|nr:hypothetical protein [Candidatus Limnocylindrales bacterium]
MQGRTFGLAAAALALLAMAPTSAFAQGGFSGRRPVESPGQRAADRPGLLNEIRIDQKLNEQVPADIEFVDDDGKTVRIGQYFGERPIVLALVYYECPMLCTQVLNGVFTSMEPLKLDAGRDFDLVVV